MISTRDLSLLPAPGTLSRVVQAMAMLDAILSAESEFRTYSFDSKWAPGERVGSMRDGCGDDLFAHFGVPGCWVKGFAHESEVSPYRRGGDGSPWPGVYESVPAAFAAPMAEPAFAAGDVTFCVWRLKGARAWRVGPVRLPTGRPDPDGSAGLLSPYDGRPETYHAWAVDNYERELDLDAVRAVYAHRPLTRASVARLNGEVTLADLTADIEEIAYPAG